MEKKKFYGWGVFVGCFLISFFITGVISNPIALYMNPICTELGIGTSLYSLTTLAGTLVMAIAAMVWAPKMQTGNMKMLMLIAGIITAGGYMVYSLAHNLVILIIASCVYNFGFAGITQMPIALLMTMWFNKNRSTYMSIAYAGGGIGGVVWAQVVSRIIEGAGWRTSFLVMGSIAGIAAIFICLFLIKKCPQEFGQVAYEGKEGAIEKPMSDKKKARLAAQAEAASWQGVTKGVALKSSSFWFLAICLFFIGILAAGVAAHTANYLVTLGWTTTAAGNIISLFSIAAVVGTLLGGILLDRLGPVGGVLFATASAAVALVCMLLAGLSPMLAYLFAILYGLSSMMPKMVPAILVSNCFGLKDYASIFSFINFVFLFGCAFGSTIVGIIADTVGYTVAWIVMIVIAAIIFIAAAFAVAGGKKLRANYPNEVVTK